jgi:hypothetical protein
VVAAAGVTYTFVTLSSSLINRSTSVFQRVALTVTVWDEVNLSSGENLAQ